MSSKLQNVCVRKAVPTDAQSIYNFIFELALYEKEPDAVKTSPQIIQAQLSSDNPPFEALIAETDGKALGMALFFQSYSTWEGKPGLYLEDLYVGQEYRGLGVGTQLFKALARIALERDYPRIDWQVLDWNEPSIEYYKSIQADIRSDWYPCRLNLQDIKALADK